MTPALFLGASTLLFAWGSWKSWREERAVDLAIGHLTGLLHQALLKLDHRQRALLLSVYEKNRTTAEIAVQYRFETREAAAKAIAEASRAFGTALRGDLETALTRLEGETRASAAKERQIIDEVKRTLELVEL